MNDFLLRAILAGIGISLVAGPLGSLMIWRRMAYFGDTLAHSTLLGVSIALLFKINLYIGLFSVCLLVAGILASMSKQQKIAQDAILGILSHSTLAFGLITATMLQGVKIDLLGYLYGDILAVNKQDIVWIFSINIIILCVLFFSWRKFLAITVQEELAQTEGINVELTRWLLIIMLALVFALAMKLVGVLLITALLIIPASSARQLAKTPEQMAIIASIIGMLSVIGGIFASLYWDWPAGPSIVATAAVIFAGSFLKRK